MFILSYDYQEPKDCLTCLLQGLKFYPPPTEPCLSMIHPVSMSGLMFNEYGLRTCGNVARALVILRDTDSYCHFVPALQGCPAVCTNAGETELTS